MPTRPEVGLAFAIATDAGWAVGLVSHDRPKTGSLVWLAQPTFDERPAADIVAGIEDWRWPVFFPLAAAIRRKIAFPVGAIGLPRALAAFPVFRSGGRAVGWQTFTEDSDGSRRSLGAATDPAIPIYQVVNDTQLREMIVSNWKPEHVW